MAHYDSACIQKQAGEGHSPLLWTGHIEAGPVHSNWQMLLTGAFQDSICDDAGPPLSTLSPLRGKAPPGPAANSQRRADVQQAVGYQNTRSMVHS